MAPSYFGHTFLMLLWPIERSNHATSPGFNIRIILAMKSYIFQKEMAYLACLTSKSVPSLNLLKG
jgi:hypothetical protein